MVIDGSSVRYREKQGANAVLSTDDFANFRKYCDEHFLGHSLRILDASRSKVAHHTGCKTTINSLEAEIDRRRFSHIAPFNR